MYLICIVWLHDKQQKKKYFMLKQTKQQWSVTSTERAQTSDTIKKISEAKIFSVKNSVRSGNKKT